MKNENYLLTLDKIIPLYYEDVQFVFVDCTENVLQLISNFLETEINSPKIQIRKGINIKYFNIWEKRKR